MTKRLTDYTWDVYMKRCMSNKYLIEMIPDAYVRMKICHDAWVARLQEESKDATTKTED